MSVAARVRRPSPPRLELHGPARVERWGALIVVTLVAVRYRFSPDIPLAFLISLALLPVTLPYLSRHRWALPIAGLAVLAALSGALLAELRSEAAVSQSLQVVQSVRVLSLAVVLACLLWARSVLGTRVLVLTFGLGSLLSLGVTGLNADNIWKFSLSVPVTLIVLSLPWVWRQRVRQLGCLAALAALSALADSRSLAAMLVIAMAITLFERRPQDVAERPRRALTALVRLGVIAAAGYLVVQAAILEGMLGEAARDRTEMQIERSGNAIVGGRPEMGAAVALISERPLGYGSGVLVTYDERRTGKEGMWSIGYDPDNGYVDTYMFGNGHEVHSVLGNLWLQFGLPGAILALAVLVAVLYGAGRGVADASIAAVLLFLAVRSVWDFALSPFASAMLYLPLTLAVLLPLREPAPSAARQGHASLGDA